MEEAVNDTRATVHGFLSRTADRDAIRRQRQQLVGSQTHLSDDDLNLDAFDFLQKFAVTLVGVPDVIAERIERHHDVAGLQLFQLFPSVQGLSFDKAMRSLELFGKDVMPRFTQASGD